MYKKNTKGDCPYCGNGTLTDESNQHDDRRVFQKCDDVACGMISGKSVISGIQYPLIDQTDVRQGIAVTAH